MNNLPGFLKYNMFSSYGYIIATACLLPLFLFLFQHIFESTASLNNSLTFETWVLKLFLAVGSSWSFFHNDWGSIIKNVHHEVNNSNVCFIFCSFITTCPSFGCCFYECVYERIPIRIKTFFFFNKFSLHV